MVVRSLLAAIQKQKSVYLFSPMKSHEKVGAYSVITGVWTHFRSPNLSYEKPFLTYNCSILYCVGAYYYNEPGVHSWEVFYDLINWPTDK